MGEDNLKNVLEYLKKIEGRLAKIEDRLFGEEKVAVETTAVRGALKEKSFMEFCLEHKSKNETDKTLVIMDFLEKVRGLEGITTKDISKSFREVREKVPANVSDKIQMLHKRGLIMPGEFINGLRSWIVTRIGLEHLEGLKNG